MRNFCKTVNKEMYTDILSRPRDATWRKCHKKMENQQLASLWQQCSNTPVGFGQGFLSKEKCDNTETSPILSNLAPANFYPFPRLEVAMNGRRYCDAANIVKNATEELKRAFTKRLPGMFPTLLQSLAEVYSCRRGLFWRKSSLNYGTIWYFSEIKWIRERFDATT